MKMFQDLQSSYHLKYSENSKWKAPRKASCLTCRVEMVRISEYEFKCPICNFLIK